MKHRLVLRVQVAFGSDFSEQWDDKSLGLKRAKGTGKLTFLISNVFKGLMKRQKSPFFQVQLSSRCASLN